MNQNNFISVCMASYNGERFIKIQITSILKQISSMDELIIVDDCSKDSTVDQIRSFNDERIKLCVNNKNLGVLKTFEKAITIAKNEIIYLSDQDDFWFENKVAAIKEVFNNDDNITLVISNAEIVDNDKQTGISFFKKDIRFSFFENLKHNSFIGCCMAFKKNSIPSIFPFPKNIGMHDWWIGLNHILFGKPYFLNTHLIGYRRHGQNATSGHRSNIINVIGWRLSILLSLIKNKLIK